MYLFNPRIDSPERTGGAVGRIFIMTKKTEYR